MPLLANLALLLVSSIILVKSAAILVHAVAKIGGYLRLSEFTVTFILIALVTSLPEISIGIGAALSGKPTLALGTALGSNLTDLTLIIAIPTLVAGSLQIRSILARRDAYYMIILALVPMIMLVDRSITRLEGFVLLVFYGMYLLHLFQQRHRFSDLANHVSQQTALKQSLIFFLGGVALLISAEGLVFAAENLANLIGIPISLIGIVLIAVGTSLPELAFELKAISLNHQSEVLGNILGSVVANSTLVLALTALIKPIVVEDFSLITTTILFLLGVLFLFTVGIYREKKLGLSEALLLLLIYALFLISEVGIEIAQRLNPPDL